MENEQRPKTSLRTRIVVGSILVLSLYNLIEIGKDIKEGPTAFDITKGVGVATALLVISTRLKWVQDRFKPLANISSKVVDTLRRTKRLTDVPTDLE